MKYLITGGAGFIGSHIAEHLDSLGEEIIIFDDLSTGHLENIKDFKNIKFIRGDIRNFKEIDKALKGVDRVFHLAAMVSVITSIEKPEECLQINTLGTLNLLKACVKNKVQKVVLSSSCAVYGDNPKLPKKEAMYPEPLSPYALSKLDGEYLLKMFSKLYNIKTASLRYFNVFGPRQDPSSMYSGVISIFTKNAKENKDIIIYGDGKQTRDFIFVKDVVQANMLAMEKGSEVYNAGLEKGISIKELAEKIITLFNSKSKIIYKEARIGDIKKSLADATELKKLGFKPKYDLTSGLKQFL